MPSSPPVYDSIGQDYIAHRQTDPRWAALIHQELGDARRVLNVGSGTGSYEPASCSVLAVEPSAVMVAQRGPGAAPAVRGSATALPVTTDSFDAVLAILTVHHWGDWRAGLREMCRVAPRRIILTMDFAVHARFWLLAEYLPEVAEYVRASAPTIEDIATSLHLSASHDLPLPVDMRDGVLGAHWQRPEAYLDPVVRANCSPLALADQGSMATGLSRLESDIASGAWNRRHADLLSLASHDLGYRLLVSDEG